MAEANPILRLPTATVTPARQPAIEAVKRNFKAQLARAEPGKGLGINRVARLDGLSNGRSPS